MPKDTIHAKGVEIGIYTDDFRNEFISLTDIARYKSKNPFIVICNWMRDRETIEFLVYGKSYIIQILNLSKSIGLKVKLDYIVSQCHPKSG